MKNEIRASRVVEQSSIDDIIDTAALGRMYSSLRGALLEGEAQAHGAHYFLEGILGDQDRFLKIAFDAFRHFGGDPSVGGLTVRAALRQLIDVDPDVKELIS